MKKVILIAICTLLVIAVFSQSRRIWEKTASKHSILAYEEFIKKYPDGEYTEKAKKMLEYLRLLKDWNITDSIGSIAAYQDFINRHPKLKSDYNILAEQKIKDLTLFQQLDQDWKNAISENSIEKYKEFISKYPDSRLNVRVARKQIIILESNADMKSVNDPNVTTFKKVTKEMYLQTFNHSSGINIRDWVISKFNEQNRKIVPGCYATMEIDGNYTFSWIDYISDDNNSIVKIDKNENGIQTSVPITDSKGSTIIYYRTANNSNADLEYLYYNYGTKSTFWEQIVQNSSFYKNKIITTAVFFKDEYYLKYSSPDLQLNDLSYPKNNSKPYLIIPPSKQGMELPKKSSIKLK